MKHILILLAIAMPVLVKAQAPDYKERMKALHQNIYTHFYDENTGLFRETTDSAARKPYSSLTALCAFILAANDAERLEPGRMHMKRVMAAIGQYYNPSPPAKGYQHMVAWDGVTPRYYDENQAIAFAYMDAYTRTRKKIYLDKSLELYRFFLKGYDTVAGGGVYSQEKDLSVKTVAANASGILVALQLYKVTGQKGYLDSALLLYNWANKHLQSDSNIVYNAIDVRSLALDSTLLPCNAGSMITANVMLYHATQEKSYLEKAQHIAAAAKRSFYEAKQKLPDNYLSNAVLLRGCIALYKVDGNADWINFFKADAERIWKDERDESGLIGREPVKQMIDQAAMMEMYASLAMLP